MLGRFIRLAEAPPEKIREYALQWGALETCEHDMPLWHWGDARCNLVREEDGWSEPLSVWRFYSRNARAVLRVAAEIHEYGHARLSTLEELWEQPPGLLAELAGGWEGVKTDLEQSRTHWNMLSLFLDVEWVRWAGIKVVFQWDKRGPRVALSPPGLFGALAVQLIYAVSQSNGLLVCSNCGAPFIPTRRRDMNRRIYCTNCGRKAALRDAARRHRIKERAKDRRT
jgi:DNA-directed RNA polymerase subunit RPC12/RpoP